MTEKLLQYHESHYAPQDYPVLRAQLLEKFSLQAGLFLVHACSRCVEQQQLGKGNHCAGNLKTALHSIW